MKCSCFVNNKSVTAIVDSASDVTIMSEKLYDSFHVKPLIRGQETMKMAANNKTFIAKKVGPVKIKINNTILDKEVYVAAIHDYMLLGIDILREVEAKLEFGSTEKSDRFSCKKVETVDDDNLGETPSDNPDDAVHNANLIPSIDDVFETFPVKLPKKLKIPSFSELVIPIKIPSTKGIECISFEAIPIPPVFLASSIQNASHNLILCFMNNSARNICLPKGMTIGFVSPIAIISTPKMEAQGPEVRNISVENIELPTEVEDLYERSRSSISPSEQTQLKELLYNYSDVFAANDYDLGNFSAYYHHIDVGFAKPVNTPMRRTPMKYREEEAVNLRKMLDAGVIEPSTSAWASCPVFVRKKDGKARWCLDFRALNDVTKKDLYPLPNMSECMDALDGNVWFSKLDCNSAFWQIPMAEESKKYTSFRCRDASYQFTRLPYGLCNSPASFCRAMGLVMDGLTWTTVLCFMDDICCLGKDTKDHLKNLEEVFKRFRSYGLKFKPRKCELFTQQIEYLGRLIGSDGYTLTDRSVETIQKWTEPTTTKEVERFLGLANWHRQFIKDFSEIAEPLHRLLRKKIFIWGVEQRDAFIRLKEALLSPEVLAIPNKEGRFILDCDASETAIGAQLLQIQEGVERVIAYGSFGLTKSHRKYCTTKKELLAVVKFTTQFRHYLLGQEFTCRTDHNSLVWLMNFKLADGQIARWLEHLGQFNIHVEFKAGSQHVAADALSRIPVPLSEMCEKLSPLDIKSLPCGGCPKCVKLSKQWEEFEDTVDDVVNLSQIPLVAAVGQTGSQTDTSNMADYILDPERCSQEQKKDDNLSFLLDWFESGKEPDPATLALAAPAKKFYWANKELFLCCDKTLYYQGEANDLLVIPESLKDEVLRACHDLPSSAHQGIARTKQRVNERFFWFKLSTDVKRYVHTCSLCSRFKPANRKNKFPMVINHAGAPMEKVHMDFMGPLPKSKAGNEHLLVMIDQFTKWIEVFPLPSQNAELTAKTAINEFFCRLGYPTQIVTDQAKNFDGDLFRKMCKILGIKKSRTTAYRPSANGQAERMNRSIIAAIRCYVNKGHDDWDLFIPQIASAIRSAVNRHTGLTPNRMMLGRELNTPIDLMFPMKDDVSVDPVTYLEQMVQKLKEAHTVAREALNSETKRAKKYYDLHAKVQSYKPGDPVLMLNQVPTNKLSPRWIGPGVVMPSLNAFVLTVLFKDKSPQQVNHDSLKPCHDRTLPNWLLRAQADIIKGEDVKYCVCRKSDDHTPMVFCDSCEDWFHCRCVGLTRSKAQRMLTFICPNCKK